MSIWSLTLLAVLFVGFVRAGDLKFTEQNQVVRVVIGKKQVVVDFEFRNDSGKAVTMQGVASSCSCSTTEFLAGKTEYAPNESGTIRITIDVGNVTGESTKRYQVYKVGDKVSKPDAGLSVKVVVPALLELSPKTVKWSEGEDPQPKTIRIQVHEGHVVRLKDVAESSGNYSYELKEVRAGVEYQLIVTPKSTGRSPATGVIQLTTDSPIHAYQKINAYALVEKAKHGE